MIRTSHQLIRETARQTGLPKEKVKKILEGYYRSMETRYFPYLAEFQDRWFVYRLSGMGRRSFIQKLRSGMDNYVLAQKQKKVIAEYKNMYQLLLQFIAKKVNLRNLKNSKL